MITINPLDIHQVNPFIVSKIFKIETKCFRFYFSFLLLLHWNNLPIFFHHFITGEMIIFQK